MKQNSLDQQDGSDWAETTMSSKLFQIRGAVTRNAVLLTACNLTEGATGRSVPAERSACWPGTPTTPMKERPNTERITSG